MKICQNLVSLGSYYGETVVDFKTIPYGNIFRNCYSHLKVKTLCKNVMATNFIKSARKRDLFLLTSTIWCNKCFLDRFTVL